MATTQFSLRWNNYVNHLTYAFDSLRHQEDLVDVTLSCEGRKIRAHKVILSACSTYFREVFQENPCQHPVIVFKNVRHEDLAAIIEFIYQGEVNVLQDSLPSFLNTAEMLAVQGLTESEKDERETQVATPAVVTPKPKIVQTAGIVTRMSLGGSGQTSVKEPVRTLRKSTTPATETSQPKRKRFFIDSEDNIAIESINFVKPDIIGNANVQFAPMKIDLPEYIDITATADESGTATDEVLIEERIEEAQESAEEPGDDSQDQEDIHDDSKPQIISVKSSTSDVEEQSYTVEGDSAEISASEYAEQSSKYAESPPAKFDVKTGQETPNTKWSQCQYCKLVITTVNLWRHVRTQHTSQPPRKCEYCQKSFKNKYSLREHIRIAHEYKTTGQSEGKDQK
ncbi:Zinc finger C2H2 superfamily [Sergentomyia squamirostris]